MLKKIKYFILGTIFATAINAGLTFATDSYFQLKRVDYPIVLNGMEVNLQALILNFEGTTYIPLRKVATITGAEVEWSDETKTVFITNTPKEIIKTVTKEVPVEKIVYVTPPPTPIPTPISPITVIASQNLKYEGTIVNSTLEGFGKLTWANGDIYVGEFKNGKREGKGTSFGADGTIMSGTFSNGAPIGYGIIVTPIGVMKGYWSGEEMNNKQIAYWGSVSSDNQTSTTTPSTSSSNISMYTLLKERLDKQLAYDISTLEKNYTYAIKSMMENLNARGIANSSIATDNEKELIDEKNENIERLKEKYSSDLAILKNLYGIQ